MSIVLPRPHLASGVELFESALTVPWRAGMAAHPVPLDGGRFEVTSPRREPVLVVRLDRGIADVAVVVRLRVGEVDQPPVVFAPFSAEGTLLPGFRPTPSEGHAGPFTVDVQVHRVTGDDRWTSRPTELGTALGPDEAAQLVSAVVLEGVFARLLYLGTLEKQRCIRQAREIAALRHRELAHHGALDAYGRDLGVPRLAGESDAGFRARLEIYARWRLATPEGFDDALNGPGAPTAPNAGLPARVGITDRFRIIEQTNEMSVSLLLVAIGPLGTEHRDRFHQRLRADHLLALDSAPSAALPKRRRTTLSAVRRTLRDQLVRPATDRPTHLAPLTAVGLDAAVRLMRALGNTDELTLVRAHDPAGGSRYELGLGVELAGLSTAALDRMGGQVARVADSGIPELALLAQALDPRPGAEDPAGRWLFEACGLRTVHLLGDERIHLSPLPSHGLRLEGPAELGVGTVGTYVARYHAGGSAPGVHVRALEAADDAVARLSADGLTPLPDLLTPAQLHDALTALSTATSAPAVPDAWQVLAASGVMTTDSRALASAVLAGMNLDQVVAFALSAADVATLGTGDELRDAVAGRIDALLRSGFYTVRCVVDTSGRLLVLASVSVLPGAAGKIGEPPPASFIWHTTRLPKPLPGSLGPARLEQGRGGRAEVRALEPGLAMLVCIGYARRGLADPFEIRVEPASDDTILTLDQYGYLMNLLEAIYPIGIEINTFAIRRNHVDADGDGVPEFLSSRVSRTYNRYRHARPVTGARPRNRRGDSP